MNATYESELYHHGVKGQKWGVRRYQNADGSLTAAGKKKYYKDAAGVDSAKAKRNDARRRSDNAWNTAYNYDQIHIGLTKKSRATSKANWDDYNKEFKKYKTEQAAYKNAKKQYKESVKNDPELQAHRAETRKKIAIAAGATALTAVGAYTLHKTGADKKIADSVIQAGRDMSKKAYNKFYDRPIDTKARVVTPGPKSFKALPTGKSNTRSTEDMVNNIAGLKRAGQTTSTRSSHMPPPPMHGKTISAEEYKRRTNKEARAKADEFIRKEREQTRKELHEKSMRDFRESQKRDKARNEFFSKHYNLDRQDDPYAEERFNEWYKKNKR